VSRKFGTVCTWLRYCADEELIGKDPTRGVDRPAVDREKQKRTHLNVVEWAQLLRAARDHSPTAHALVALLGMKGLRVSEACQLDIDTHLFTKDGYDQIRFVGKGNKASTVTLPPPVARAVREITDSRPVGPLLLKARGRRLDRASANRLLQNVAREGAVLTEFSPHSLRRTMITLALGQGIPLYEVQLLARHANSKTTELYDMNRRNVDRLSGASVASFMSSIAG
jgi:integrase/recombinase XerD